MTVPKLTLSQKAAKSVINLESKLEGSVWFIVLIVATTILFAALLVFTVLASNPAISEGLFQHGIANVSAKFPLNITPASWAFFIWNVIYGLQLIWNIYSLGLLCRNTSNGPAYLNPVILSPAYFIFFNLSSAFSIGWLFLWDRLLFLASFIFLACIALSLFLTFSIAAARLVLYRSTLADQGRNSEVTFLQIAVINGVATYATWTAIATIINLGIVLKYKFCQPVPDESASIICIGILAFFAVVYITMDITVIETYTRFCLSPYAVIIWALAAIVAKNNNPDNVSSIMSVVLLGAVFLAFVMKLGITFYKSNSVKIQYKPMKMGQPLNCPL